jgi:thiosulfate/3-mercaptopyruvate sulfurtransferase
MSLTTLVDAPTLAAHLADPAFVIVDCQFKLDDPAWGRAAYERAHVPGALYADLNRDLSGTPSGTNGRHPLPPVAAVQETFSRLGIDQSRQVVAYDQDNGMFASRLWWMLRWLGHDAVAVLDGGLAAWVGDGFSTSSTIEFPVRRPFEARPRLDATVTADEVAAAGAGSGRRVIDARAPQRFRGEVEPIDRAAGHIPGARNYFFMKSVGANGRFDSPASLRARLESALDGVPPERAICYCGSGVTAAHVLLAMQHAGLTGGKLYPGSWSEWSSDAGRPVETGDGEGESSDR